MPAGVTGKLAPLALVPRDVPPEAVVYQLMLLPVEVAFRLVVAFTHSVDGVAVTDPGADGAAVTPTVVVTVLVHPLEFVNE